MAELTPLDRAHAALAEGGDAEWRLYYTAFAAAELFVPLKEDGGPEVVTVEAQSYALTFDTESRLQDFAQGQVDRAVMTGRALVAALAGQGGGIGLNLGVAETAMLLDPETLNWIAAEGDAEATEDDGKLSKITAPKVSDQTLQILDGFLARLTGGTAYLCGSPGGLVLLVQGESDTAKGLAQALAEALALGGATETVRLAMTLDKRAMMRAARVGLRFDLPDAPRQTAPGSDPDQPPKLR